MREFADGWFEAWPTADRVTEIREAKIKPNFRANMWFVEGRDLNLLVDSGFGLVSLGMNAFATTDQPRMTAHPASGRRAKSRDTGRFCEGLEVHRAATTETNWSRKSWSSARPAREIQPAPDRREVDPDRLVS